MRAVDGLSFDGGVPPRIVEHDVAGIGQIQTGAGGPEAQQEDRGIGVVLERVDNLLAFLGLASENVRRNLAGTALGFEQLQHLNKLAEEQNLLALRDE